MIVNAYVHKCCMLIASQSVTGSAPIVAYSVSCAPFISLSSSPNRQHTYSKTHIFEYHFPTPFNPRLVFQLHQLTIQQGQGDTSKVTGSKRQAAQTDPFGTGGAAHPQHLSVHRHIHRMPQDPAFRRGKQRLCETKLKR